MNSSYNHHYSSFFKTDFCCTMPLQTNKKILSSLSQNPLVENPVQNPAQNLWNSREKLCAKNLFSTHFSSIQWKIPTPWKSCAKFYHYFSTWKIPLLKPRFSTFST